MSRVVVVTTSFPERPGDAAGCFVEADARALAADGREVHVVCGGTPSEVERRGPLLVHRAGGADLFRWPGAVARARAHPSQALGVVGFALGVRRLLGELRPDAVVAHWLVPSALLCSGYPLERAVAHGADVRLLVRMPALVRAAIVRRLVSSRIQFVAHRLRDELAATLAPPLRHALMRSSFVEPCPLDLPELEPARRERRLVVCGRLVPDKRVELALEAAALLDVPILVIGDGPSESGLRRRAAELNARATFVGRLARGEALALIAASDALLHCSRHEAAPTVVREARALGVPVIATNVGDLALWAAKDPGIFVVRDSAAAIVSACHEVSQQT